MNCNHCQQEVFFSSGKKLNADKTTMHICSATDATAVNIKSVTQAQVQTQQQERQDKIDKYAQGKIDALNNIADAIRELSVTIYGCFNNNNNKTTATAKEESKNR